jgi:hypothetical protein
MTNLIESLGLLLSQLLTPEVIATITPIIAGVITTKVLSKLKCFKFIEEVKRRRLVIRSVGAGLAVLSSAVLAYFGEVVFDTTQLNNLVSLAGEALLAYFTAEGLYHLNEKPALQNDTVSEPEPFDLTEFTETYNGDN